MPHKKEIYMDIDNVKAQPKKKNFFTIGDTSFYFEELKQIKDLFNLFRHKKVQKILTIIEKAGPDGVSVMDIWQSKTLNTGQSLTSIYLKKLRDHKLVGFRKSGRSKFYTINSERIKELRVILDADKKQSTN